MFFAAPGKASFSIYLCALLRREGRKRSQLRLLFLFLGGALDVVRSVRAAIVLATHLELPGFATAARPAIVCQPQSAHSSNVNRKGMPRLTALRLWLE